MSQDEHIWANGALVCNCGAMRKPGASEAAPPGWPNAPSEPVCQVPVHVSLTVGPRGEDHARIVVNGVDLTRHVRGFKVEAGVGAVVDVWLDLIGVTVDIQADVPRSRIQALTPEQDEVRQGARQQRDVGRGKRDYSKAKDAPGDLLLAVSLGQVKA